jgi:hypothetical protein
MADSALWESLDRELNAMVEHFSNLVRAAAVPDEEGEQVWVQGRAHKGISNRSTR